MQLNDLKPAKGSTHRPKRVGRGIGSGLGKTSGKGHKGQHARSGGYHKVGFEGGQMPIQRRVPKFGFNSRLALITAEIRLSDLNKIDAEKVTIESLQAAGIINKNIKRAKIFDSGKIEKAVTVSSEIRVTKGARKAIEAQGGKVEA